jgi:predicted nucleic acid-binding protein
VPSALVLDTSGLLAVLDANQRFHAPARKAFDGYDGPLLLSPFVLAELDYLLTARVSQDASVKDLAEAVSVIERYPDLGVGLADAA